jgi:hypothetical protein
MAEAVCGFQQVSEKPAAKPGEENRSLPTISDRSFAHCGQDKFVKIKKLFALLDLDCSHNYPHPPSFGDCIHKINSENAKQPLETEAAFLGKTSACLAGWVLI